MTGTGSGQSYRERLTAAFPFREGIYCSFGELLKNEPKYDNCILKRCVPVFGQLPYYRYLDPSGREHELNDSIYAVVNRGRLFLRFQGIFYKRFMSGAIMVFVGTNWVAPEQQRYDLFDGVISLVDFESGRSGKLSSSFLGELLQRDPELFNEFEANKPRKNNNALLQYVIRYNDRNPFYLP